MISADEIQDTSCYVDTELYNKMLDQDYKEALEIANAEADAYYAELDAERIRLESELDRDMDPYIVTEDEVWS